MRKFNFAKTIKVIYVILTNSTNAVFTKKNVILQFNSNDKNKVQYTIP